jgi:two-component system, NarL family, response regulator DegU
LKSVLTKRQIQILNLTAQGYCGKQISAELGIDIRTVKIFKTMIFKRLDAQNSPHAVAIAIRKGFIK